MAHARTAILALLLMSGCKQGNTETTDDADASVTGESSAPQADPDGGMRDAGNDWGLPPDPLPDAEYKAGSRLRPVFTTLGEAKVFDHWFDAALGADCTFIETKDGQTVCMPRGNSVVYADPACTEPLLLSTEELAGTPLHDLAFEVRGGDFCTRIVLNRIRKRGSARSRSEALYSAARGQCAEVSVPEGAAIYETSPASIDVLVSEKTVRRGGSGRLRATYREMSDGSIERLGWYDSALPMPCAPHGDYGNAQCLPTGDGYRVDEALVGETCDETVQLAYSCGEPFVLGYSPGEGGGNIPAIWRLEQQQLPFISRKDPYYPDVCLPEQTEYEVWRASPVPADDFASLLVQPTQGRIAVNIQRVDGLPDHMPKDSTYHDSLLDIDCWVGRAQDGKDRCLPWQKGGDNFLDSACTQRVYYHSFFGRDPGVPNYVSELKDSWTGSVSATYRVGAQVAEDVNLFYLRDEGCVEGSPKNGKVYAVEEVAAEEFVEAITSME